METFNQLLLEILNCVNLGYGVGCNGTAWMANVIPREGIPSWAIAVMIILILGILIALSVCLVRLYVNQRQTFQSQVNCYRNYT